MSKCLTRVFKHIQKVTLAFPLYLKIDALVSSHDLEDMSWGTCVSDILCCGHYAMSSTQIQCLYS